MAAQTHVTALKKMSPAQTKLISLREHHARADCIDVTGVHVFRDTLTICVLKTRMPDFEIGHIVRVQGLRRRRARPPNLENRAAPRVP
jgi:hypothetical protein